MAFWDRHKELPSLVAAAEGVNVSNFAETQALNLSRQSWQLRAFGYYDEVGEVHYAARYVGNALSKIRLIGAEAPSSQRDEPKETTNKAVKAAIDNLKSPKGGQSNLMKTLAINLFIAGEAFLIGTANDDGSQDWEALSVNELEIRAGTKVAMRRTQPGAQPKELPPSTLIVRVWQQHPRYSSLADSSLRTCLDECEKLLLLTRADKAAARSRIAGAGLLYFPNEAMPVVQQPAGSTDQVSPAENPVYQNLIESMIKPIKDEQHPSSIVPVMVFGPAEYADKIKYFTFDRPQAARAQAQREESIQRIATAVDLPPEILTGKATLNHWAAWVINEDAFQSHLQGYVELICDAITVGYLHPALQEAGVTDYEKYRVWYDASELVVRPNKSEQAGSLYEANVINEAAYRREAGFDETDKMSEDEYAKKVGIILKDEKLALTGEMTEAPPAPPPAQPALPAAPETGPAGDSPTLADKTGRSQKDTEAANNPVGTPPPAKTKKTPPKKPVTASGARYGKSKRLGNQLASIDIELMTQLRVAASEVMVRELDRAGARIRSKAAGNEEVSAAVREVPNHLVASVLGPSVVASLSLNDHDLLHGAFSSFAARAAALIAAAQVARNRLIQRHLTRRENFDAPDLDAVYGERDKSNRDTAVGVLLAGLLGLAASKLYDPAPSAPAIGVKGENDGLLVPGSLVREVVAAAGGSVTSAPQGMTEPEDFGGVATGGTTTAIFADNGVRVLQREWVYGPAIRTPFIDHEDLDGVVFSSWDDEQLAVNEGGDWIGVEYYHPGDHSGCLCSVAPVLDTDLGTSPDAEGE